ncbi:MAG: hypothetical protein J6I73_01335 [Treponema sp.]|nr:hypothetical protein [Treponema sp.]
MVNYKMAIDARVSRRKYIDKEIEKAKVDALLDAIEIYNKESGLHMQLVLKTGGVAFDGFKKSYGFFVGVKNYLALIGKREDEHRLEKEGWYGEKLVLEATDMGLSTCWVGTSYDKSSCSCDIAADEVLDCVITLGYSDEKHSLKELLMENMMKSRSRKTIEQLTEHDTELPDWFIRGMEAVQKAPTARNSEPFVFTWKNNVASARACGDAERVMIDVGIAKLHFEIGADGGSWDWGNGAQYTR